MEIKKVEELARVPYTALFYCPPGVGKSTAIGLIAEASKGNTLVLDVDRTISRTLAKGEVVKDTSKVMVVHSPTGRVTSPLNTRSPASTAIQSLLLAKEAFSVLTMYMS